MRLILEDSGFGFDLIQGVGLPRKFTIEGHTRQLRMSSVGCNGTFMYKLAWIDLHESERCEMQFCLHLL